jgi:hypothetical protein
MFIDGGRWESPVPPLCDSIQDCKDNFVFLWDKEIISKLPYFARSDGKFEGPRAGVVIELQRSILLERLLLAGRIAQSVGHPDAQVVEATKKFAADIWSVLKSMTLQPLAALNLATGELRENRITEFRAGDDAINWAKSKDNNYLSTATRHVFFKPRISS